MPALQGYPSQGRLPAFQLLGPALAPDQYRCLNDHLEAVARENVEHMNLGCLYQVYVAPENGVCVCDMKEQSMYELGSWGK